MLILDRVLCDLCLAPMGQLHNQTAEFCDWVNEISTPPHYAICPDCYEASRPVLCEAEQDSE